MLKTAHYLPSYYTIGRLHWRHETRDNKEPDMSIEMWAVFKDPVIPGCPDAWPQTFSIGSITSNTPDSPDEVPGTRNWIRALVELDVQKRNEEVRRERYQLNKRALKEARAKLLRKSEHYKFATHMFVDEELPQGEPGGCHTCQKQDVTQLYRGCRSCHYDAQRRLAEFPDIE